MRTAAELDRGRQAFARCEWGDARGALEAADGEAALAAEDLELLARAAYMLGDDDAYAAALERAHRDHLQRGDRAAAARVTWWIGHSLLFRGELGPARGWFARGERLLEDQPDCVERGYVLIAALLERLFAGDHEGAHRVALEVVGVGRRFGDADLIAIGRMEQGHALVRLGRTEEGLRLVDESMAAVTAGELSPPVAGIVYCNTIAFCQSVYELRRAREWTAALTRWCERQPDMVAHKGVCLVHRAELMTLGGAWSDALEELQRLHGDLARGALNRRVLGRAAYGRGEVHRLRGEVEAADDCFREASRRGYEPQPGLALLRLAEGQVQAAAATIRRAVLETLPPLARAALLPAYVEIMLEAGDLEAARSSSRELAEIAAGQGTEVLAAMAAQAAGQVALAEGDAEAALLALRRACRAWQELEAPHEAARARVLAALACRALADEDAATLELDAAREACSELGAAPSLAWIEALRGRSAAEETHGLSGRELEVLRLVAAGKSNREIAADLVISERTVARHLQNIFTKLRVSSRTAASAFAFEHQLI